MQLLTPKEVQKILACSSTKLKELRREGKLETVKLKKSPRGGVRITTDSLERFINSQKESHESG